VQGSTVRLHIADREQMLEDALPAVGLAAKGLERMKKVMSRSGPASKRPEGFAQLARTYVEDETAWLDTMVRLIKQKRFAELDYENLTEFLESMAKRDRREVKSRLVSLMAHLLKWQFQPRRRSRSWHVTILNQRSELQDDLTSKTLRNHAQEVLPEAYQRAVRQAAVETGLAEDRLPAHCPFSLDFLLSDEFSESEALE